LSIAISYHADADVSDWILYAAVSMSADVVMYSPTRCRHCDRARALLKRKGATVPQIFIDHRHVGGYDHTFRSFNSRKEMRYKLLGRSGLRVSELCLGAMTFGSPQWGTSEADAVPIYTRFRDAGGNFVDTANEIYGGGQSEEILGRIIAGHREEVVLASKYSLALPGGRNPNLAGNHRKSLRRSLESSLRRLGTDYLDVLWLHAWDGVTPADEIMRALDDVVREGKVQYVGVSNMPAWVAAQCNTLADAHGWTPFVGLQIEYSLIERTAEEELLPMARAMQMAICAWSPLASGILSGKYANPANHEKKRLDTLTLHALDERSQTIAALVGTIARKLGCSSAQVALNWLRAKQNVIPLIGARTLEQLEDNLRCLDFEVDAASVAELDALSASPLRYPHRYLAGVQPLLHAGFHAALDTHRR